MCAHRKFSWVELLFTRRGQSHIRDPILQLVAMTLLSRSSLSYTLFFWCCGIIQNGKTTWIYLRVSPVHIDDIPDKHLCEQKFKFDSKHLIFLDVNPKIPLYTYIMIGQLLNDFVLILFVIIIFQVEHSAFVPSNVGTPTTEIVNLTYSYATPEQIHGLVKYDKYCHQVSKEK